jgi:hypothetical protein
MPLLRGGMSLPARGTPPYVVHSGWPSSMASMRRSWLATWSLRSRTALVRSPKAFAVGSVSLVPYVTRPHPHAIHDHRRRRRPMVSEESPRDGGHHVRIATELKGALPSAMWGPHPRDLSSLAEVIARGSNYRAVGWGYGPFEEVAPRRRSLLGHPNQRTSCLGLQLLHEPDGEPRERPGTHPPGQ